MLKIKSLLTHVCLSFVFMACSNSHASNKAHDIRGKWKCGPAIMKGPNLTVTVNWTAEYLANNTYIELTNSQIDPTDRPSFSTVNRSEGRWNVKGDVLETQSTKEQFISATDPSISKALGQKVMEDQVIAKPISLSRILKLNSKELHTFPINAKHKEAEITTYCIRQ